MNQDDVVAGMVVWGASLWFVVVLILVLGPAYRFGSLRGTVSKANHNPSPLPQQNLSNLEGTFMGCVHVPPNPPPLRSSRWKCSYCLTFNESATSCDACGASRATALPLPAITPPQPAPEWR